MGLTRAALLILTGTLQLMACANAAEMSTARWPRSDACEPCQVIQFGPLEFKLSAKVIDRVFIAGQEPYGVHFFAKTSPDGKRSAVLMSKERDEFVGKYVEAGLQDAATMHAEQFLDLLGRKSSTPGSKIPIARRAEGIENATAYIKAARPGIRTYLIQGRSPEPTFLHIVVDNDDTVYTLAGDISPELYAEFLGRMRRVPIP